MSRSAPDSLTEKQAEALDGVWRRKSSKEIARDLGISPWSVDKRIDAARAKLGAQTRDEAARIYAEARYGESLTGELLAVTFQAEPVEIRTGASQGADPSPPRRRSVLWLDPKRFGPVGRLGLILAGAMAISLFLLTGLGIANGLQSLLEP